MADNRNPGTMRLLYVLTGVVGAVWVCSLVLDMVRSSYDPPQTIGLAFMAILSTLLGMIAAAQRDGGRSKSDEDDEEG